MAQKPVEHITRDSPRNVAPEIKRPWLVRAGFITAVLLILAIILIVVRLSVGDHTDPTSRPATTIPEIDTSGAPTPPATPNP